MKQLIKELFVVFLKYFWVYYLCYFALVFFLGFINLPISIKDSIITILTPLYGIIFVILRMKKKKMSIEHMKVKTSYSKECLMDTSAVLGLDIGFGWIASILLGLLITVQSNIDMAELADNLWMSLIVNGILIPVDEEFFFRGYLLDELEHHGRLNAAIAVSVLFGIAHFNPLVSLSGFVISMLLFELRFKYNSIWPGILVHIGFNMLNQINAWLNTEYINPVDIIMIGYILLSVFYLFKKRKTIIREFMDLFSSAEKSPVTEEVCHHQKQLEETSDSAENITDFQH